MGGLGIHHNPTVKKRAVHRIKIVKGHIEKVLQMTESNTYCLDIINQSRAVQSALREIDNLLLENHLKTCAVDLVKKGKENQSVGEIMKIFRNGK